MLLPLHWTCAACGELNESAADPSQGARQQYVEDCHVCCRPNVLSVVLEDGTARAETELEGA